MQKRKLWKFFAILVYAITTLLFYCNCFNNSAYKLYILYITQISDYKLNDNGVKVKYINSFLMYESGYSDQVHHTNMLSAKTGWRYIQQVAEF